MTEQKAQTTAEAIQAELEAVEPEIASMEQASREDLARVRAEIMRQSRVLAEAQIDLSARRAWDRRKEGQA